MRSLRSRNVESSSDENIDKEKNIKTKKNRKSLNRTENCSELDETKSSEVLESKRKHKNRKVIKERAEIDEESLLENCSELEETKDSVVLGSKRKHKNRKVIKERAELEEESLLENCSELDEIKNTEVLGSKRKRKSRKVKKERVDLDEESLQENCSELDETKKTEVLGSKRKHKSRKVKKERIELDGESLPENCSELDETRNTEVLGSKRKSRKVKKERVDLDEESLQENCSELEETKKTEVLGSKRKRKSRKVKKERVELDGESLPENCSELDETKNTEVLGSKHKNREVIKERVDLEENCSELDDTKNTEVLGSKRECKSRKVIKEQLELDEESLPEIFLATSSDTDQELVNEVKNQKRHSIKTRKSTRTLKNTPTDMSITYISSPEKNLKKSEEIEPIVIDDSIVEANLTYDIINSSEVKDESTFINRSGEWAIEKIENSLPIYNDRVHLHSDKKTNTPRKRWVKFDTLNDSDCSLLKNSFTSLRISNSTSKQLSIKKSAVKSVPNFKAIHQKAYDKLENLKDYSERKKERAENLLAGKIPDKKNISKDLFSNIKAQINEIFKDSPEPKELNGNNTYEGSSVFKTTKSYRMNLKTPSKINNTFAGHTPKVITDKKKSFSSSTKTLGSTKTSSSTKTLSSTKTPKFIKDKIDKALRINNSISNTKTTANKNVSLSNIKINNSEKKTSVFKPLIKATHIPIKINLDKKENVSRIPEMKTTKPISIVKPTLFNVNLQDKPIFTKGSKKIENEAENKPKSIFTKGHLAAVANKTKGKDKLANINNRRDQIKGVRTNRRFDLLMQMRNN